MSRTLTSLLVLGSAIFLQSVSGLSTLANREGAVTPGFETKTTKTYTNVEVTFEGLMVLHQKVNHHYEVGILKPDIATNHTFRIEIDGTPIDLSRYPRDGEWALEVKRPSGRPNPPTSLHNVGHQGRLQDSQTGQSDFSWAVDLESSEFHGHTLNLKRGNLQPIIQLPGGELSTKYKAPLVERHQGAGGFSDFGFVAETTALNFQLEPGETLILRVGKTVIFQRNAGPASYKVDIHNSPNEPSKESHFMIYYQLFTGIPDSSKFDFKIKEPKAHPLNEYPDNRWIDGMPCGLVVLGKRIAPLR